MKKSAKNFQKRMAKESIEMAPKKRTTTPGTDEQTGGIEARTWYDSSAGQKAKRSFFLNNFCSTLTKIIFKCSDTMGFCDLYLRYCCW